MPRNRNRWIGLAAVFLLLLAGRRLALLSGPRSVDETSESRRELSDRTAFIDRYVPFQRTYLELEYDVEFHNTSGVPPGPSDWDIRLVARVPAEELDDWIPPGANRVEGPPPDWLETVPGAIPTDGIHEWYEVEPLGYTNIGIDRQNNIVAYRDWAM